MPIYVSSYYLYVSSYYYIYYYLCVLMPHLCVLILLYICPHTAIYMSSCYYICVLILLYMKVTCRRTTCY